MKNYLQFLVCIAATYLLVGCAPKFPSERDSKNAFESDLLQQAHGKVTLDQFIKLNGREVNAFGAKAYVIDFKADLNIKEALRFKGPHAYAVSSSDSTLEKIPKDTRFQVTGEILFKNTEKGWIAHQVKSKRERHAEIDRIDSLRYSDGKKY